MSNWYKKSKKWGEDYFPGKRDLIHYMPELGLWNSSDYSKTELAEAIRNPDLRENYDIPAETWRMLEMRYSAGLPLESNMMMLNIHDTPEKIERKPFKR